MEYNEPVYFEGGPAPENGRVDSIVLLAPLEAIDLYVGDGYFRWTRTNRIHIDQGTSTIFEFNGRL